MNKPSKRIIDLFIVTVLCFSYSILIYGQNYSIDLFSHDSIIDIPFVSISTTEAPVFESTRPLITGIDLNKMLTRYIEDFDAFEGGMIPYPAIHGMKAGWRVKPIPGDPDTNYFYGKKRNDPYFRRKINITIAIAKSHRDALLAANDFFLCCSVPPGASYSNKYPGFVKLLGSNIFVLDNLFVDISISGDIDSNNIIAAFVEDLKNGCDGLYKEEIISPPSIHYEGKLSDLTFDERYTLKIPIETTDPNGRSVRANAGIQNIQYMVSEGDTATPPRPTVSVNEAGQVEIRYKGPAFSADLCVYAVNDLGIEAEPWIQRIQTK